MGAIFSKLCCCTRRPGPHHSKFAHSRSSTNPTLIIQRSHVFRDVEEGSEYTRVLQKDFEIWGRRVLEGSGKRSVLRGDAENGRFDNFEGFGSSNESLKDTNDATNYPQKVHKYNPTIPKYSPLIISL